MKRGAVIAAAFVFLASGAAYLVLSSSSDRGGEAAAGPVVDLAALTADQERGRRVFNTVCAQCHGTDALGGDGGPPLIHKIYEPSHHGDGAFYRAVQAGVPQHHWNFGNMPPMPGISQGEVAQIIDFVRAVQRQNGIN